MNLTQRHPDVELLAQYNLGKLDDEQTSAVEGHVAGCDACARTVVGLPGDTFIELLRAKAPDDSLHQTLPPSYDQPTISPAGGATKLSHDAARRVIEVPLPLRQHSRYQLQECLGVGGMGSVFKAQHRIMNRLVALKVINPQLINHPGAAERFHREVQAAARLSHPNIVTAYDADEAGGLHFLVMEYVEGIDLHQVIQKRGKLEVREACEYIRQAALGLQHAHEQGMVHRDIKPHNLMLVGKGATPVVKILDFGLANFASDIAAEELESANDSPSAASAQLTMSGSMMGTPDYIAPEQASDAHSVDIRADIYSLGCTFYCLLAGRAPFHDANLLDKIRAHAGGQAAPLSTYRDDVPAEVESIVLKMMAKDPTARYQTPQDVADALDCAIAPPRPLPAPVRGNSLTRSIAIALGGLALLLAGVIAIGTDHGTLEIRTEVDDVNVVLIQGGKEIELKDLATGSTAKRLASGEWDVKLKGNRNDVKLDKEHFTLSRLGKAVVSVTRLEAGDENRLVVELKEDGRFMIEGRAVDSVGLHNRLNWVLKDDAKQEVHVVPAKKFAGEPFRNLVSMVKGAGAQRVTWPAWVDEALTRELSGPDLDPAIADAVNELAAYFEKHLRTVKSKTASVGEFKGKPVDRVGPALREGLEKKLRADGYEVVAVAEAPKGTFQIYGESYDVEPYKGSVKLNIRWRIRGGKGGGNQGGGGSMSSYGRKVSAAQPKFVRKLEGHTGAVKSVAYSPDGKSIASASGFPHSDGTIRLWDAKTGEDVGQFKGHDGPTQSVCFSHHGKWLLAGGGDKNLRLWDVATGELLKTMPGHEGMIECVGFSPDDKIAVSGSVASKGTDHTARSWDLATGKEIARFTGHKLHVHGVAVIDETRAISVDRLGVACIWRLDNGQLVKRLTVPTTNESNSAYSLCLSPDRSQAIIGYQDHAIRVWDVEAGKIVQTLASQNSPVMSVCMTADGRYVLAGGGATGDTKVALEIFDAASGERVASTAPVNGTTWSIAVSPDGHHVLSSGGATWKAADGFVANGDNALHLWQVPEGVWPEALSGRLLKTPSEPRHLGGWMPDGVHAALTITRGSDPILFNTESARVVWAPDIGWDKTTMAVSPDGKLAAVSDSRFRIHLLDGKSGSVLHTWDVNDEPGPVKKYPFRWTECG